MKAAVLVAKEKFEVRDVPIPEIGDNEVLLKVQACGVCGSDLSVYGVGPYFQKEQIPGHEFVGHIEKMGKDVEGWNIGDRVIVDPYIHCFHCPYCEDRHYNRCSTYACTGVTVHGAYAEYVKVYPYQMIRVPESLPSDVATLFQPVACSLYAARLSGCTVGDTVVVVGAGVVGLYAMMWARTYGATRIIAVEVAETRRSIALEKGYADIAIDPSTQDLNEEINKLTGGLGAPIIIECSGNSRAQAQTFEYVAKGGTVVVYGAAHSPTTAAWNLITTKEITLKGGLSAGTPGGYEFSLKAWEEGMIDLEKTPMVHCTLDEVEEVFQKSIKGEIVKAVFMFE